MSEKTINIPFTVQLDTDGNGFSFVDDTRVSVSCYAKNGKAIETLRTGIKRELDRALDTVANATHKRAIGTVQGEVFICLYDSGAWQYSIVGPGRGYSGTCCGPWKGIDDVLVDARKHAVDGFGGIAWECSF